MMFTRFAAAVFCVFAAATALVAQEKSRAILVLDASGSMWGQIDGTAKITIAQDVIGELLTTLPVSQELGLTVYGHRRKGDCTDIETLIQPGGDRDAIAAAVNGIKPKGKTPLSAAVIAAAEALKYTEEKATVILVSDGKETCEVDPCEVGRMLEEAGVDFTAHVIGFDVADPADRAELQCLAEETGGSFRTASSAAELSEALQVVAEPEPEPVPLVVSFRAVDGDGGPQISSLLIWDVAPQSGDPVYQNEAATTLTTELLPGSYRAEVLRPEDESTAVLDFTVTGTGTQIITLVLPEYVPRATLAAPDSAPAGALVPVRWTGPDDQNDYIASADPDMADNLSHHYGYTRNSEDGAVMVRMPPEPGRYELRYILASGRKVLATRAIEVTPLTITIDTDDEAVAGANLTVTWQGPDYMNDYFDVAVIGAKGNQYLNYTYTRDGSPLALQMPTEPGTYEIRYILSADRHVAAKKTVQVVALATSVSGPESAAAGATIDVTWTGGDYKSDYISVAEIGSRGSQYLAYEYTREGSPLRLRMPLKPGDYELRYILSQDNVIAARQAIRIEPVTAALDAPATAPAGGVLTVGWTGPGYKNDYVSIAETGTRPNQYKSYTYTRDGTPLKLQMPTTPGSYELRYVAQGRPDTILATAPVTVEAVSATLEAPATQPAGGQMVVGWTGPDGKNDYIAIAEPGSPASKYAAYTYTRDGSPLRLTMPTAPGEYELRYVQAGSERKVLTRVPVTIEAVQAVLEAPQTAAAGAPVVVIWQGPDYKRDFVSVAEPGTAASKYESYAYTRDGSPLKLQMPSKPGTYELRYVMTGSDRRVVATRAITVEEVRATIEANPSAASGSNLVVTWEGPDYRNDYLAISRAGEDGYETYVYTRDGSPIILKVPDRPGAYELRYVMGQDRKVLHSQPLMVE